jgi:hypothetical protein
MTTDFELPIEIPEELRASAIRSSDFEVNACGWPPEDALKVLQSLEWSKAAVNGVQAYMHVSTGFVPTEHNWDTSPSFGETELTYARRSHKEAVDFVSSILPDEVDVIALEFSFQDDAA